jgi:uncharacterized glyoxalase superfamily protein PhnB
MTKDLPQAVPEIPVTDMAAALSYYEEKLGFTVDWGREGGGIAGISQGRSRIFLTDTSFRDYFGNPAPVVIWLNLDSKEEVDALHAAWVRNGADIQHPPESKPWSPLHEFVVRDPDGNVIRAFYNY